jgi:hypothetical protein
MFHEQCPAGNFVIVARIVHNMSEKLIMILGPDCCNTRSLQSVEQWNFYAVSFRMKCEYTTLSSRERGVNFSSPLFFILFKMIMEQADVQ